jgi:phosphoribosyl-ATP pyrophosphohydrolase/phosphoribosyl-AMP cyclohydrolase
LDAVLAERKRERPEGSYTVRLLDDENLRLKKLGEETTELVVALARGDRDQAVQEAADLVYHVMVALRGADVTLAEVMGALETRRR